MDLTKYVNLPPTHQSYKRMQETHQCSKMKSMYNLLADCSAKNYKLTYVKNTEKAELPNTSVAKQGKQNL